MTRPNRASERVYLMEPRETTWRVAALARSALRKTLVGYPPHVG
jgi:hypothetical protein